jgi:hypothetical protein
VLGRIAKLTGLRSRWPSRVSGVLFHSARRCRSSHAEKLGRKLNPCAVRRDIFVGRSFERPAEVVHRVSSALSFGSGQDSHSWAGFAWVKGNHVRGERRGAWRRTPPGRLSHIPRPAVVSGVRWRFKRGITVLWPGIRRLPPCGPNLSALFHGAAFHMG